MLWKRSSVGHVFLFNLRKLHVMQQVEQADPGLAVPALVCLLNLSPGPSSIAHSIENRTWNTDTDLLASGHCMSENKEWSSACPLVPVNYYRNQCMSTVVLRD